ncbi:hypothetical protein PPYR_05371 [Photinus pyralis]|uniref:Uncharacterized protein n=1 Tax=Photinus pyralis TaxID=7054 RepID=A0A1Y1KCE8_PHOPY|nr:uncharacterized protein LOC116165473 [Photinus pyralis]KAB0801017.1 hypothetical protein PPYR_05371 [Photinus pyralis]
MYHAISNPTRNFSLGGGYIRRRRVNMALSVAIVALWLYSANAVRISPKLDFGESSSARPVFKTGNHHDDFVLNPNFQNPNSDGLCIGNYCDITKSVKSDSSNSASTDVIVHVKTSIDLPKNQSENKVPDVPVIVGSKGPSYPEHFPVIPQPHVNVDPNYPPSSVGIDFVPQLSDDGRFVGYGEYFPMNNGVHRHVPELQWYPRPRVGEQHVHNPLEFKKTYKNVWPTGFDNGWEAFTNKRDVNPSLTPCLCENQPFQDFPIARKLKQWLGE